jgi:hypothetical protein
MLKLATFRVDCTPPVGCGAPLGAGEPMTGVRDPLYLRGFILDSEGERAVVASLDYCGLMNRAYDELVRALAEGTGVATDHVVVHCIHQHDAPLMNFEAESLLGLEVYPKDWWQGVQDACGRGAREAVTAMRPVVEVGHAETRLHGYASNRRIMGSDGKVRGMRWSRCGDPDLKREPVGVIDPMLRTVAFRDEAGEGVASMSFYATHPQVSNGRGIYSADAPGEAMRLLGDGQGAAMHAFFTGAGGNVTAGKYSSPDDLEGNLLAFGERLAEGIQRNLRAMQWEAADTCEWLTADFPFPRQQRDRESMKAAIAAAEPGHGDRFVQAAVLSSLDYDGNRAYPLRLLRVGGVRLLFLAGELFVEYQIFAQSLIPDEFIGVAGNCSDNFLYLPLEEHFGEGGYETSTFCWCTPEFERFFKSAVAGMLVED